MGSALRRESLDCYLPSAKIRERWANRWNNQREDGSNKKEHLACIELGFWNGPEAGVSSFAWSKVQHGRTIADYANFHKKKNRKMWENWCNNQTAHELNHSAYLPCDIPIALYQADSEHFNVYLVKNSERHRHGQPWKLSWRATHIQVGLSPWFLRGEIRDLRA